MRLSWHRITAHTRHPFRIARGGSSVGGDGTLVERTIVSIEHDGVIGQGEAAPTPYYKQSLETCEETFEQAAPMLGHDPSDIDGIVDRLLAEFPQHRAAVAAIDEALHDWLGKKRGMPVWKMLNLDPSRTPATSMTIGIDDPDKLPLKLEEAAGFHVLKVKVGTANDEQTLSLMRRLAPNKTIRVDANCGWTTDEASARIEALRRFDLELVEQPIAPNHHSALRRITDASPVPIITDEDSIVPRDVAHLDGIVDGINIKLSKCGGIREAVRMIHLGRGYGLKVMLGCMVETSLGVAAAAQLASLVDYVDLDGHLLLRDDPFEGLKLVDGRVLPGDGPGLGVTLRA
jgi:L-alanine-DL-glutamate epimerase-like enolase superfamily enzyme